MAPFCISEGRSTHCSQVTVAGSILKASMANRQGLSLLNAALEIALCHSPGRIVSGPGPTRLTCPACSSNCRFLEDGFSWQVHSPDLNYITMLSLKCLNTRSIMEQSQALGWGLEGLGTQELVGYGLSLSADPIFQKLYYDCHIVFVMIP